MLTKLTPKINGCYFSRLPLVDHHRQFGRPFSFLSDQKIILINQFFQHYHMVWLMYIGIVTSES